MYLVERPNGSFELRESISTPRGPRSRTAASFRVLTEDVIEAARLRSSSEIRADAIVRLAEERGVPVRLTGRADRLARQLVIELDQGRAPADTLTQLLRERLPVPSRRLPDTIDGAVGWLAASDAERGAALCDLLGLADALPQRDRGPLRFPRIDSGGGA